MKELIPSMFNAEISIVEEFRDQAISSWEELVSFGIDKRIKKDDAAWEIGCIGLIADRCYMAKLTGGNLDQLVVNSAKYGHLSAKKQLAIDIGMNPDTMQRYASTVKKYLDICGIGIDKLDIKNLPKRPFERLSFNHLAIASTLSDDKDKEAMLTKAEDENWNQVRLSDEIKIKRANNSQLEENVRDNFEKVDWALGQYVKVDLEREVIYVHRQYKNFRLIFI